MIIESLQHSLMQVRNAEIMVSILVCLRNTWQIVPDCHVSHG